MSQPGASSSSISVPLLDLKAQYAPIREEIRAGMEAVCDSQQFVLGPWVGQLEAAIADYVGAKHAIACASGSDAISSFTFSAASGVRSSSVSVGRSAISMP